MRRHESAGVIWGASQRLAGAPLQYLKARGLDPKFADGHYLLGQLYRDTEQAELARQEFNLFRHLKNRESTSR